MQNAVKPSPYYPIIGISHVVEKKYFKVTIGGDNTFHCDVLIDESLVRICRLEEINDGFPYEIRYLQKEGKLIGQIRRKK